MDAGEDRVAGPKARFEIVLGLEIGLAGQVVDRDAELDAPAEPLAEAEIEDVEPRGAQPGIDRIEAMLGRLDILVNAAAVNLRKPTESLTVEDWDRLLSTNLKGAFFACQEAIRVMRAQTDRPHKAKIINVGSIAYEIVVPNIALYAISKGGMRQMTRSLAIDYARENICINSIGPGRFWTQMTDSIFSNPALYDSAVSVIPMGRPGLPSELAGATVFLASDASDYITGQTLMVDGGWTVGGGVKA